MIKFFTIIFLVYYIFRVLKPSFMVGTFNKLNEDFKAFNNAKDDKEKIYRKSNRLHNFKVILKEFIKANVYLFKLTIKTIINKDFKIWKK